MPSISSLLNLIHLQRLDECNFLGQSCDIGNYAVFGGQVIGQGLSAAQQTIDESRQAHSLHAYFLRAGDLNEPIRYEVELTRNGRSFATRRVQAIQHNQPILQMAVSFQIAEDGVTHQTKMPQVPMPKQLAAINLAHPPLPDAISIPKRMQHIFGPDSPFEFRFLDLDSPVTDRFQPMEREPRIQAWIRLRHPIDAPPMTHRALLAYISDFGLLETSGRPHGLAELRQQLHMASLDHALWFHRPCRVDEWLLYDYESPSASNARGFNRGQIFNQDGILVASSAQEGLIRLQQMPPTNAA